MSENVEKSEQQVLQEKQQAFLKEYGELVTKHTMDFATYPVWVPDGQGGFKTVVQTTPIDTSNLPVKSNFVADEPAQ